MTFELRPLGFERDALEPVIDENTISYHYDKHHQTYVNNLNKAVEGTEFEEKSLEWLIENLDKVDEDIQTAVRNNGGGVYNHNLYWETMTPGGADEPVGNLKEAIEAKWDSLDSFKEEFDAAGAGRFGSGWVYLVEKDGEVEIMTTPNQDCPLTEGYNIILINDVWEHAYYLQYQNKRAGYLEDWWKLVNWDIAEERFNK